MTHLCLGLDAHVKLLHSKAQRASNRVPTNTEHDVATGTRNAREFPALLNDRDGFLGRADTAATARHDERGTLLLPRSCRRDRVPGAVWTWRCGRLTSVGCMAHPLPLHRPLRGIPYPPCSVTSWKGTV